MLTFGEKKKTKIHNLVLEEGNFNSHVQSRIAITRYLGSMKWNRVINEVRYTLYSARGATIPQNNNRSQCAGCAVYAWFIKLIDIDNQHKCVLH